MSYLATIARETGWSADYILWHLPYALGLGIEHAACIHHGQERVFARESIGGLTLSVREAMRQDFEEVKRRYSDAESSS